MNKDKSYIVKKHFAETAKRMIVDNGVQSISVRKVASEAGYSYATIYNHFKNLDELLWLTRDLFIKEIVAHLGEKGNTEFLNRSVLIDSYLKYANYYIENKNVFEFLYFHKLNKEFKYEENITENPQYEEKLKRDLEELSINENISLERASAIYSAINYSVHGILTLCFAENDQIENRYIESEIRKTINLLFSE